MVLYLFIFFFHQKSEGIWHLPSAGTFNQNLRAFTFSRYFQSESEGNNSIFFRQRFFSLAMPLGCPQITTVYVNAPSCKTMIKVAISYMWQDWKYVFFTKKSGPKNMKVWINLIELIHSTSPESGSKLSFLDQWLQWSHD